MFSIVMFVRESVELSPTKNPVMFPPIVELVATTAPTANNATNKDTSNWLWPARLLVDVLDHLHLILFKKICNLRTLFTIAIASLNQI